MNLAQANQLHQSAILLVNTHEKQRLSLHKMAVGASKRKITSLLRELDDHAEQLAKACRLPYASLTIDAKKDFGLQVNKAYQKLFEAGYDSVIAITNDCPSLRVSDVRKAQQLLQENQNVLGPAEDGGLYLLGLQKDVFCTALTNLPWQSNELFEAIKDKLATNTSAVLPSKRDIDTVSDVIVAFNKVRHQLKQFFTLLMEQSNLFARKVTHLPLAVQSTWFLLRAP